MRTTILFPKNVHRCCALAFVVAGALHASTLVAQEPRGEIIPRWTITTFVGSAPRSTRGEWGSYGHPPYWSQLVFGIHAEAPVLRVGPAALAYAPEIIPLYVIGMPSSPFRPTSYAYGNAIIPAGVEVLIGPRSARWRAVVNGGVGCAWFTQDVPVPDSRAFNFLLELGGGVGYEFRPPFGVRAGYAINHLSNWWTGDRNPGLNGRMFYLGLQYDFAHRHR